MGVLNPLKRKTLHAEQFYSDNDLGIFTKQINAQAEILAYADHDDLERFSKETNADIQSIRRNIDELFGVDLGSFQSMEEMEKIVNKLNSHYRGFLQNKKANAYALLEAKEKDVEPDYDNPVDSIEELMELREEVREIPERVNQEAGRSLEVDQDIYSTNESYFSDVEGVNAFPVIEGVAASLERIDQEIEELMEKSIEEFDSNSYERDRPEIPVEVVQWSEVLDTDRLPQSIEQYIRVDDLPGVTYGDTLHLAVEELLDDAGEIEGCRDSILVEEPLHFTNPQRSPEKTPRPDVVDDMVVYDFKYLPKTESDRLRSQGSIDMQSDKFIENVHQMNGYLNDLHLDFGVLVYVDFDFEVKQYVIERHQTDNLDDYNTKFSMLDYDTRFVEDKEEYDFPELLK
ncbi:MAG: hypothetical protein J07AB43_03170 [Candidatus Nanosalina sp. J07AB43]|nr:MAG: hypothetical protein J07AB43_03170 [Candidatus Nanosalina sp. J07AB43]